MSIKVKLPVVECRNDGCPYFIQTKTRKRWSPRTEIVNICPVCMKSDIVEVKEDKKRGLFG